jgi:hypothetical protein
MSWIAGMAQITHLIADVITQASVLHSSNTHALLHGTNKFGAKHIMIPFFTAVRQSSRQIAKLDLQPTPVMLKFYHQISLPALHFYV